MERLLSIAMLALAVPALAGPRVAVASLPEAVRPLAEAETNLALRVDAARLDRLVLSVSFASCETNEVLVALGADANADGDLSFDEAALAFGCDCGAWYLADMRTGEAVGQAANVLVVGRRAFDPSWNLVKVVRRGFGDVGASVATDAEYMRLDIRIR